MVWILELIISGFFENLKSFQTMIAGLFWLIRRISKVSVSYAELGLTLLNLATFPDATQQYQDPRLKSWSSKVSGSLPLISMGVRISPSCIFCCYADFLFFHVIEPLFNLMDSQSAWETFPWGPCAPSSFLMKSSPCLLQVSFFFQFLFFPSHERTCHNYMASWDALLSIF